MTDLPAYSVAVVVLVVAVLLLERYRWRTGLLRSPQYWVAIAVTGGAGVLVDAMLTDAARPLVIHDPASVTGLSWPGDIPVEDFASGWGLVTLTILVWIRLGGAGRSATVCRRGRDRVPVLRGAGHRPGTAPRRTPYRLVR